MADDFVARRTGAGNTGPFATRRIIGGLDGGLEGADPEESWEWLKTRLVAGDNVTITLDEDEKLITLTAEPGGLQEVNWEDIGGDIGDNAALVAALAAKAALSHNHGASEITSGTLGVQRGGTGLSSFTTGNFLRAASSTTLEQRTAAQVLADIGAAAAANVVRHDGGQTLGSLSRLRAARNIGALITLTKDIKPFDEYWHGMTIEQWAWTLPNEFVLESVGITMHTNEDVAPWACTYTLTDEAEDTVLSTGSLPFAAGVRFSSAVPAGSVILPAGNPIKITLDSDPPSEGNMLGCQVFIRGVWAN